MTNEELKKKYMPTPGKSKPSKKGNCLHCGDPVAAKPGKSKVPTNCPKCLVIKRTQSDKLRRKVKSLL